jgi:hypothetical protein
LSLSIQQDFSNVKKIWYDYQENIANSSIKYGKIS